MNCMICNEYIESEGCWVVDGLSVCQSCYEYSKDNFIITCTTCCSYGFIKRSEVNMARLASMMLISEGEGMLTEELLNVAIAFIQIQKPTVFVVESCRCCIDKK